LRAIKNHGREHGHNKTDYRKRQEKAEMTKNELNKYKNVLETGQAELVHWVRNRDGIAIEKSPDALDECRKLPNASWRCAV
jgi:hypothetical protein